MPITFTTHKDDGLFITRYTGCVTESDFLDVYRAIRAESDRTGVLNEVADVRSIESIDIRPEVFRALAEQTQAYLEERSLRAFSAVLAPRDVVFGLSRTYGTYADLEGLESSRVFRNVADIAEWIGIDPVRLSELLDPVP